MDLLVVGSNPRRGANISDFEFKIIGVVINIYMKQIDINDFKEHVKQSQTLNELRKRTGLSLQRIKRMCEKESISVEHFTPGVGKSTRSKAFSATKICVQCKSEFITTTRKQFKIQQTCSCSCSNKFFRTGSKHGNWKPYEDKSRKADFYRRICFERHGKKCIVCEEKLAIDVHHLDGNHKNNHVDNLIPLCANHHRYMHMKEGKQLISDQIESYLKNGPLV